MIIRLIQFAIALAGLALAIAQQPVAAFVAALFLIIEEVLP